MLICIELHTRPDDPLSLGTIGHQSHPTTEQPVASQFNIYSKIVNDDGDDEYHQASQR